MNKFVSGGIEKGHIIQLNVTFSARYFSQSLGCVLYRRGYYIQIFTVSFWQQLLPMLDITVLLRKQSYEPWFLHV